MDFTGEATKTILLHPEGEKMAAVGVSTMIGVFVTVIGVLKKWRVVVTSVGLGMGVSCSPESDKEEGASSGAGLVCRCKWWWRHGVGWFSNDGW